MAEGKYIAYYRVSTDQQGRSGLGLEAQQKTVADYLNGGSWKLVGSYTEVESGKDADNRPQLQKAMRACRIHKATLVISRLDRLSRDAAWLLGLEKQGYTFVCASNPHVNRLTIGVLALVAEQERSDISSRTKAALAAAKARGVKLGGNPASLRNGDIGRQRGAITRAAKADARADDLAPIIDDIRGEGGTSLRAIAAGLNERGIGAPRGGQWTAQQVKNVLVRV